MLLTPHTLIGVATALVFKNPFIAAPLSFALHFAGDLVPHWDFYTGTKREERTKGWRPLAVMFDMVIGVAIGLTFTLYALWVLNDAMLAVSIFLSGIASVLPDVLTGPSIYLEKKPKISVWMHGIQSKLQFPAGLPWGIVTQIIVCLSCLLAISRLV